MLQFCSSSHNNNGKWKDGFGRMFCRWLLYNKWKNNNTNKTLTIFSIAVACAFSLKRLFVLRHSLSALEAG